ncbi:phosphate permease, partial [Aphelenchoides avenae]
FATSVGSGAISLKAAYVLATFVESAGGILMGYKVLETLRFKVIDLSMYEDAPNELLLGQVAVLGGKLRLVHCILIASNVGCAMWMCFATLARLPVSSTHSHIGSIIGFSLVMRGPAGLHMDKVITIVISWIVSPVRRCNC